ncbi:MAG: protein kinase [Chitinivibrionales bacterium]|nr:protein kinase [Chitinivibrionales bacterium]
MSSDKIIIKSQSPLLAALPNTVVLPDGTKDVSMGSGKITSLISSGGSAIIYEIWNPELEVTRAVKLLHPDHSDESEGRFQTEMKITAKLHHPNIVEIYAVGKWQGLPYIEMECIDGFTLEKLIEKHGSLPLEVCSAIGLMVGRALNYAHNQEYIIYGKKYRGVIHRDLKPANIMVNRNGQVKLMDFGIARPMTASMHTMEGMVIGTMQYLAPEQLDGKEIDIRADIYSLGTVMFEMLTGSKAFPETNLVKLVPEKISNNFTPLENFQAKIPRQLCKMVHKCMRYEKEHRVQNAMEFLRSLGNVHKKITKKSPEQIMVEYMKQEVREKTIISVRKKLHIHPAYVIIPVFTLAAVVAFVWWGADVKIKEPPSLPPQTKMQSRQKQVPTRGRQPQGISAGKEKKNARTAPSPPSSTPKPEAVHNRPAAPAPSKLIPDPEPVASSKPSPGRTQPAVTRPVRRKVSLLERKKRQYGTSNIMEIIENEFQNGHFSGIIALYPYLPENQAASSKARLYKLRSLRQTGPAKRYAQFLMTSNINDGEFYLAKARYLLSVNNALKADEQLRLAATSPLSLATTAAFRKDLAFTQARCATALLRASPSEANKRKAMEAWFNVKSLYQKSPGHSHYKRADEEIRRINKVDLAKK